MTLRTSRPHGSLHPSARLSCCLGALIACASLLVGCEQSDPRPPELTRPLPSAEIKLEQVDLAGYEAEVAKHRGKVVLVDFWATWCPPCKAAFPETVQLHQRYKDRGLVVISMSLDDPEKNRARALLFLNQQNAEFINLINASGGSNEAINEYEIDEGIPHFKIYGKQGKVRFAQSGRQVSLERRIEELLAE